MNTMHEANRRKWNTSAPRWKARKGATNWRRVYLHPEGPLGKEGVEHISRHLGSLQGKNAVVLGSGDNKAAFALAGLGANVTSVDISERQLEVAAERAGILGVEIDFQQGDLSNLPSLPSGGYHFACSIGGVSGWISDLWESYREAYRLLAPGGLFQISESHTVTSMWNESDYHYFDQGPHKYSFDPETGKSIAYLGSGKDERADQADVQFLFHWKLSDYLMALIDAGFEIVHMSEQKSSDLDRWRENPIDGLPRSIHLVGKKK